MTLKHEAKAREIVDSVPKTLKNEFYYPLLQDKIAEALREVEKPKVSREEFRQWVRGRKPLGIGEQRPISVTLDDIYDYLYGEEDV